MAGAKEIKNKIGSINNTREDHQRNGKGSSQQNAQSAERVAHSRPYAVRYAQSDRQYRLGQH